MKTYYNLVLNLAILLSTCSHSQAQSVCFRPYVNGDYGAIDTFPAAGVADDYGPRRVLPYNWHGGIDYNDPNGDNGHLLLAPVGGTIVDVNRLLGPGAPNAKEIAVDVGAYRYLFIHIFYNSDAWQMAVNNNTIVAKAMYGAENSERWAIIMNINDTLTAIGQTNGFVIHEGDTLAVTNSVPQYGAIGPLGSSGE